MTDIQDVAPNVLNDAAASVAEFGWGWLIVAAAIALMVAPLVFAVLAEVSDRLDPLKMLRTLIAAISVGVLVWLVSVADGQAHAEVHGLVCLGVGAASYWLGPLLRSWVKKVVKKDEQ